jgi:curved DNA-binding protein CbpA
MAVTNDHSGKDLYTVLGVASNATADEIRKARMKLARELHPDRLPEGAERAAAEERLKEVNHAHGILSDSTQRAAYDEDRANHQQSVPRGGNGAAPSSSGQARAFAGGPAAAAHSRGWGLKGLLGAGAAVVALAAGGYYAFKKMSAPPPPPSPASVLAAHQPSDPNAPGAVFMTRLQLDMATTSRRRYLQDQLGITEGEASRIQRVFMGVRDVHNPDVETPYDKIAKAMKNEKGSVTIKQPLKEGKNAIITVDGKQVSVAIETGDLKGTQSQIVFPHSAAIKAAFAPDRNVADIKVWDDHADRVSGKAIQFPISGGKAAVFIGDSVWKLESSYERSMATGDNTKRVFDDGRQFSEFWQKVLRDRVLLETSFAGRGEVGGRYNLADGTTASIHITPQKVEFERIDLATGNKRSFVQETAAPDRLKLSEPAAPMAVRSTSRPSP